MAINIPNSIVEKKTVLTGRDYFLFIILSVASFLAILNFGIKWFSFGDWNHFPVLFPVLTFMLLVFLLNNQGRWFLLPFMRKPIPVKPVSGSRVAVVTTFVGQHEALGMLAQTLKAMLALDYPHKTWVLDEGDNEAVRSLCDTLGVNHFSRKNLPQYQSETGLFKSNSKHGNYNAWLDAIGYESYDYIAAFDPDHVPAPEFLTSALGYFEDPDIGYVQAAQAYYNQKSSFIARGAAEETFAYYSSVQMANYGLDYPIIVGCHNSHRVSALKQVGGFAPHDADDLLLTANYRVHGWQGIYVPEILAKGLNPVDWNGYLNQQRRWARSVLDLKFRVFPELFRKFTPGTRIINGLHGLNYLHRSVLIFVGLLTALFMTATGISPAAISFEILPHIIALYFVLQSCEFYRQQYYLDRRNEWGVHWRVAILDYAKWPFFLLAIYDVLRDLRTPYVITSKVEHDSKRLLVLPNAVIFLLFCLAATIGLLRSGDINPVLYLFDTMVAAGSVFLILTDFWRFPSPFEQSSEPAEDAAFKTIAPLRQGVNGHALEIELEN